VTRWDGARGSRAPYLLGPIRPRTPLLYTPTWRFLDAAGAIAMLNDSRRPPTEFATI
jgi:hypothetical protein